MVELNEIIWFTTLMHSFGFKCTYIKVKALGGMLILN